MKRLALCVVNRRNGWPRAFGIERCRRLRRTVQRFASGWIPSEAAAIRSLPEAMARIESLLTAGRADTAAMFVEAERGLKTMGKVGGRDLTQFRFDLHLKWLRRDWKGIWGAEPPPRFAYKGTIRDIDMTDSRPPGFIAEYDGPTGPLKVVFLVLDMRQLAQQEAAKTAGNH